MGDREIRDTIWHMLSEHSSKWAHTHTHAHTHTQVNIQIACLVGAWTYEFIVQITFKDNVSVYHNNPVDTRQTYWA